MHYSNILSIPVSSSVHDWREGMIYNEFAVTLILMLHHVAVDLDV